jgi:hypothetical protein
MLDHSGMIEDFMGVKIGDLNHSVSAHFGGILPRNEAFVSFESLDRFVVAGEEFEIEVALNDVEHDVVGGQWSFSFDGINLMEVLPRAPGLTGDMWHTLRSEVRFAWTSSEPMQPGAMLKMRLQATRSGRISEMIRLDDSFLQSEIYDQDDVVYALILAWKGKEEVAGGEEIQLHQNRPNPWNGATVIPFEIPGPGEVTLHITNALGEEIHMMTNEFAAGKQQFTISNDSWPQGLYYYTIRFGDTQLTKTMLILNNH